MRRRVFLSRHCGLLKAGFRLVLTSWSWLPLSRQSSFCNQWDEGKGEAEFLMWPTNFQLISINLFLDLSKTKLR